MRARGKRALGVWLCLSYGCSDAAERQTTNINDIIAAQGDAQAMIDTPVRDAGPPPARERDAGGPPVSASGSSCPSMWDDCPSDAFNAWNVIADASDFGSGASFEALAGDLVLVHGGSAEWRVVRFGPDLGPSLPGRVTILGFPAGDWAARGLARVQDSDDASALVLACEGDRCTLLEATLGSATVLHERANAMVPTTFTTRGLAANDLQTCVFGSGVLCLDQGAWTASLALPAGEEVIALELDGAHSVALTNNGRVFNDWQPSADVHAKHLAFVGKRALFYDDATFVERAVGEDDTMCALPEGVGALFLSRAGSRRTVVTGEGDVLSSSGPAGFCRTDTVALTTPVRAASSSACGLGEDLRVITGDQLIGDNRCDLE